MGPQSKQQVTSPQLASESCPRSDASGHSGSTKARRAMSPGHLGSTSNTFLVNNSGTAQGQQQGSAQYKEESNSAQKMASFFQRGHIQPLMLVDPHGNIHAVDKETKKVYWTTKTGRHAFKFLKDEDKVLKLYFHFDASQRERERTASFLVDENDIYLIENEKSFKVEGHSVESLENTVHKLSGEDFEVTGNTEELWVHVGSGDVLKCRPLDTKEHMLVVRKDFRVCNRANDWELSFSDFEICGDAEGGRVRDESIKMLHCRDYDKYFTFMAEFKIQFENLTVFYDKRCRWEDGRVTFRGRFNRYAELTNVTAELVAPANYAKKRSEHYVMLGWHTNILRFYERYEGIEDTFLLFESYDHKLTNPRKEDPNGREIMRSILSGVLHLFDKNCLHGKLVASNVVITAENEVKLCGLLPETIPSKSAIKKEMRELRQLLKCCVFGDVREVPKSYKASDPLAYDLFTKLMYKSNSNPSLKSKEVFVFIRDVTHALDDRHSSTDAYKLNKELATQHVENLIFGHRNGSLHRIFVEHMEHSSMYCKFRTYALSALLRFIRNSYNHMPQLAKEVKDLYGGTLEGIEKYYAAIFPALLVELYNVVHRFPAMGGIFNDYY
ncbi:ATP-dependent helicase BRM isoform X1, partial [Tanacetum coccineum]